MVLHLLCGDNAVACFQVAHSSRSLSDGLPTKLSGEMRHGAVNPNDGAV